MPKRIPEETKQRAIRLVLDHLDEYPNLTARQCDVEDDSHRSSATDRLERARVTLPRRCAAM